MKKSFVLVSLKESKAKKLAEVISNNTCRKILDFMAAKKDVTENDLSKALKIPLSTVHYNMKALLEAKLVRSDEFHYSPKGKEVNHYRLANQYVVIAPEGEKAAIKEKLKSIIPTALIMGAAAGIIRMFSGVFGAAKTGTSSGAWAAAPSAMDSAAEEVMTKTASYAAEPMAQAAADEAVIEGAGEVMREAANNTAVGAAQHAPPMPAPEVVEIVRYNAPEIALWFLFGAVSGVVVYLLVEWIVNKIRSRL